MPTIFATADMSFEYLNDLLERHNKPTIQQQVDKAMREQHIRQTREPVPNPLADGCRLSMETVYNILKQEEANV